MSGIFTSLLPPHLQICFIFTVVAPGDNDSSHLAHLMQSGNLSGVALFPLAPQRALYNFFFFSHTCAVVLPNTFKTTLLCIKSVDYPFKVVLEQGTQNPGEINTCLD